LNKIEDNKIFFLNINEEYYSIDDIINEWKNYKINNLKYLMYLNIFANRSFNDLTQYPVFPWLFCNYNDNKKETRNLSLPMGMIDFNENAKKRKEIYLEIYETMKNDFKENNKKLDYYKYLEEGEKYYQKLKMKINKNENDDDYNKESLEINPLEINQRPHFYGSHYSNPIYVSHFLMRIFPFANVMIEIQGNKFDNPNRLFFSLEKTFESVTTQKVDLRELIPEFFYFPEMFLNINNFNLVQNKKNLKVDNIKKNEKIENEINNKIDLQYLNKEDIILDDINNVNLPKWCQNKSTIFVKCSREKLENENNLHQ
jgi:hypothetical protein